MEKKVKSATKVAAPKPATITPNSVKDALKKKVRALASSYSGKNSKELRVDAKGNLVVYKNRKVIFKSIKVAEAVNKYNHA